MIPRHYSMWLAAIEEGKNKKMPLFRFLKDAIIRAFGEEFYNAMETLENET
jgi:hypothetical protein